MTIYNVANASQLTTALQTAIAGDTINLADGSYGSYSISSLDLNDPIGSANPGTWITDVGWNNWESDPARPENNTNLLITGGTGAVFTTLFVEDCTGINFHGFKVSHPTVSFDGAVMRIRGCTNILVDRLTINGAPLASDVAAHSNTGYGRGQGILCGNTAGGTFGDENYYVSIRGCYVDTVNDGIRCHGSNGGQTKGKFYWVYKNQVYQVSTDAFRLDGTHDTIFERNMLPYHYHPTVDAGESAHNDTFQSSSQGAARAIIRKNIRLPGFQGGSRAANHVGHSEGSVYTMQGPFLADGFYVDCIVRDNFMIIGNQNAIWLGEDGVAGTTGVLARNNTMLRDPLYSTDDSQGANNVSISIRTPGTGTLTRNVRTGGVSRLGQEGTTLLTLGYGSWATTYNIDQFYNIDTDLSPSAWTVALTDLTPVAGTLTDPNTHGANTYGAYELLEELAANSFAWPPAVDDTPAAPVITGSPTISGTENVGQTLTATAAPTSGNPVPTRTWQWYNSVSGAIAGATSNTYTLQASDEGDTVYVVQTETNTEDVDTAQSANTGTIGAALAGLSISSFSPADNATGVSVSSDLIVTFNQDIQFGTGTITLWRAGLPRETWNVELDVGTGAHTVSISGAVLTINTQNDMRYDADYSVHIDAGAIESTGGAAFAGFSDDTTWNYSTESLLATRPHALSFDGAALHINGVVFTLDV